MFTSYKLVEFGQSCAVEKTFFCIFKSYKDLKDEGYYWTIGSKYFHHCLVNRSEIPQNLIDMCSPRVVSS